MNFVGRETQLDNLKANIARGLNTQIVAPSGYGKTAFLKEAARLAQTEWEGAFRVAYVNAKETPTETAFWDALWAAWGKPGPAPKPSAIEAKVAYWTKDGKTVVICLDNFDALAAPDQHMEFLADFFTSLRALSTAGARFVVTAPDTLGAYLAPYYPTSPFFNVFRVEYLGKLSVDDAEDFLTLHNVKLTEAGRSLLRTSPEYAPAMLDRLASRSEAGKLPDAALKELLVK